MGDHPENLISTHEVQILRPEREDSQDGMEPCLCCGRRSFLDKDGCGICEECVAS